MTVRFVGEPNYQLIEEALRKLLMSMTPEQRQKYARAAEENTRKDDLEPIGDTRGPQNQI